MQRTRSLACALLAAVIWASSFPVVKACLKEFPPATLAFLRSALAVPVLLAVSSRREVSRMLKRDLGLSSILALAGVSISLLLEHYSLIAITATAGSILINTSPVFMALLSSVLLGESLGRRGWLGIGLAFLGASLVATEGEVALRPDHAAVVGSCLMLGSAICWAIYSVLGKDALRRYSPIETTAVSFGLGALYLLPLFLGESCIAGLPSAELSGWLGALHLGLLCSALAYYLWYKALSELGAGEAGAILYTIPPMSAAFSYAIIGEIPTPAIVFGAVLVLTGIYLVERERG